MEVLPEVYDSCELQSKRKFCGEWGAEESSEGRGYFPPFKTGQCLCTALGHQERRCSVLCYGVSYTPFWLPVMKTLCLEGSWGKNNDFHN